MSRSNNGGESVTLNDADPDFDHSESPIEDQVYEEIKTKQKKLQIQREERQRQIYQDNQHLREPSDRKNRQSNPIPVMKRESNDGSSPMRKENIKLPQIGRTSIQEPTQTSMFYHEMDQSQDLINQYQQQTEGSGIYQEIDINLKQLEKSQSSKRSRPRNKIVSSQGSKINEPERETYGMMIPSNPPNQDTIVPYGVQTIHETEKSENNASDRKMEQASFEEQKVSKTSHIQNMFNIGRSRDTKGKTKANTGINSSESRQVQSHPLMQNDTNSSLIMKVNENVSQENSLQTSESVEEEVEMYGRLMESNAKKKTNPNFLKHKTKVYGVGKNNKLAGLAHFQSKITAKKNQDIEKVAKKRNMFSMKAKSNESNKKSFFDQTFDSEMNQSRRQGMSMFTSQAAVKNVQKHEDLRGVYIDNYGVTLEFPSYYYLDSKFVPSDDKMVITMGFHIIPTNSTAMVQSTFQDGRVEENTYDEIYSNTGDSILLILSEVCGRQGFKKREEVQLTGVRQAIMNFSNSGKYFGLFLQSNNSFHVFDSSDIHKCFKEYISIEKINNKSTSIMSSDFKEDIFQNAKKIEFDCHDKYVAVVSNTQIIIFNIETGKMIKNYKIDINAYESILDIVIDSNDCDKGQYNCVIACKSTHITQIHVFDINEESDIRSISYMKKGTKLTVKISHNLKQVIISNGEEHYIHTGNHQQIFPWIKDKFVRKVVSSGKDFYLITSKDYDRDIDILHSGSQSFNASVPRSIEPGLMMAYDALLTTKVDDEGNKKEYLKTLIKIGDYLYYDLVDIALCNGDGMIEDFDPEDAVVSTSIQKFYSGYGFNWPYFSYATMNRKILILNCFNPNFVQRYEFPAHTTVIHQTFLTDTHDFYAIIETTDDHFEIYHIDLDSSEPKLNGPIVRYSFDHVNDKPFNSFHARGSSHKEKINLNKTLMFFMIHGDTLWAWKSSGNKDLTCIEDSVSNLYYLSDDQVFYMVTKEIEINGKDIEHSQIKMIEALFGSYKITDIYNDKDNRAEILNFGVDNTRKRLIILTGIKNHKSKRDKFITLYDIESEKILYHLMIKNREIIGRLKSNLYNFVEGHIYYRNKVIKVRYDQLERMKGGDIPENQLFDHYSDILQLNNPNNEVQSGTPLQTCMYNRLAYIIRNGIDLKARKILIMPYLHERKIYLNRRHEANQFYSMIEHNGEKYIYCMCIDQAKIYIYTDTGILVDRILYREISDKCGKPQELSENARYFVFRKGDYDPTISLVRLEIKGLKVLKEINMKDKILSYILKLGNSQKDSRSVRIFWETYLLKLEDMTKIQFNFCMNDHGDILVRIKPTKQWLQKIQKENMENELNPFTNNQKKDESLTQVSEENCSFFYYICNNSATRSNGEYIYFDSQDDDISNLQGVSMNSKFVFFWNLGKVWRLCLDTKELSRLSIYVSELEMQTFIKQVRTGSDENLICVRVTQSPKTDCIIVWDLEHDLEKDAFDVLSSALFFQDRDGNPYVAENDYIINCTQGCKLKCYNLKVSDFDFGRFGFMYGHRVNMESHNYIIFRNWINLSFSYMTFVIKDNFDKSGYVMDDYLFDQEGYDYILKKKNIFFEGDLVKQQYEKLNFILKNYRALDPVLLESLQYKNEDTQQIPLHLALEANNNRMVNLILNNMAKIDFAAVGLIKDVFSNLIEYQHFVGYLKQSPFQSVQMLNKQTLKLKRSAQEDEEIIIVRPTSSSYVDEDYFKSVVGEIDHSELKSVSDRKTFAVKIECVKADWIINEEVGLKFLKEMLRLQDKDVFVTKYIQIIVQFLYNQFKSKIMSNLMPFYVIQFLLTMFIIMHSASFPDHLAVAYAKNKDISQGQIQQILELFAKVTGEDEAEGTIFNLNAYHRTRQVIVILISIFNIQNIYIFVKQSIKLKHLVFKRMWSLIDMVIITCNLTITVTLFLTIDEIIIRVIEAILIVFLLFKSLYFLRFVGEIAPLVDIIFVIMSDIKYFMVIFLIAEVAFVTAFYCIGRNQRLLSLIEMDGDAALIEAYEPPQYSTLMGAIDHVYLSSLGEFDSGSYFDNQMTPILLLLFIGLSFFMCIHLLNMLIAIMGESFAQNNEVKEAKKKISQLQFVVENWWLDPIKDKKKIVYLVAAFNVDDDDQDQEKFDKINEKVEELRSMQMTLITELKNMQGAMNRMASQQQKSV